ncbi:MAG TPA: hypothetical protein VGQ89_08805 [Candidatus Limnocylindrales bacterium]|jgi:hypothetical protein|nr:hypothetical protein [Candidatus Limnocylindrales bacterium]
MHTDRETTRIVRSWLDEGVTALPDRVLDAVLDQVPATRQRRSWWPSRRFADMNSIAKFAIAAAAVVVVAVVGINLLPRTGGEAGGGPVTSASPSASPSPSLLPSPAAADFPPDGDLAIGRHSMTRGGVRLSISVPTSGWHSEQGFFINNDAGVTPQGASFLFWNPSPIGIYADPCAQKKAPPAGPSTADLAAAVSTVPGTDLVSGPSDVKLGGHDAKHVVFTVPEGLACGPGFHLWYGESEGESRYATALGSTHGVWIVDVDGTRLFIEAETYKGATPEIEQEVQQIIDSIQFE